MIRNFLSNALKFTPEGGTVTVRACFLRSAEEKANLSSRRKPPEKSAFAWFPSIFAKMPSSQKSTTTLPVAMDGDVEMSGVQGVGTNPLNTDFHNGMLYISVVDSGAGISAENQKKLFKEIVQFNPEKLQVGFTFLLLIVCRILLIFSSYVVCREEAGQGLVCISARALSICTKESSQCSRKEKGQGVHSRSSCPCNRPRRQLGVPR